MGSIPQPPVKRVEIPKPDGSGIRKLGIPTVLDRIIQQAIYQELVYTFEATFSENSYGFRIGRRAQQAVLKAQEYIREGCESNIMLDDFDKELEKRKLRFARYADDCNIYVKSEKAGKRVMESVVKFLTSKLKLKVNQQKSAVAHPWDRKFLGFTFRQGKEPGKITVSALYKTFAITLALAVVRR